MSMVKLAESGVLSPDQHLTSPGLTHYGTSLPLGSFAHGKRASPQQEVTCVAASSSSSATTTGQLMECGSEGYVTGG